LVSGAVLLISLHVWRSVIYKKFQNVKDSLRAKRGLLGVDAGILIAFFTITMFTIYLAAPAIMSTLFTIIIGGPEGIYSYLLELPLISTSGDGELLVSSLGFRWLVLQL
jgi:hypothetical protein